MRSVLAMTLVMALFVVAPILAQDDAVMNKRVDLKLEQAGVRQALKQLFDSVGVSYNIDSAVDGEVTVSLRDVPFRVALDNVLKAVNAVYRVESGVFQIVPRVESDVAVTPTGTEPTTPETTARLQLPVRIQLEYASPYQIAQVLGANVAQIGGIWEFQNGGGFGQGGFGGGMGQGGFGGGFGGGNFGGGFGQGGFGGGGFGGFGGGGFGGGGFGGGGGPRR